MFLDRFIPQIYIANRFNGDHLEPSSNISRPIIYACLNLMFGTVAVFSLVFAAARAIRFGLM